MFSTVPKNFLNNSAEHLQTFVRLQERNNMSATEPIQPLPELGLHKTAPHESLAPSKVTLVSIKPWAAHSQHFGNLILSIYYRYLIQGIIRSESLHVKFCLF